MDHLPQGFIGSTKHCTTKDARQPCDDLLYFHCEDVFTTNDDHVLGSATDVQLLLFVLVAQVSTAKVAILGKGLKIHIWSIVIPSKDGWTADANLAHGAAGHFPIALVEDSKIKTWEHRHAIFFRFQGLVLEGTVHRRLSHAIALDELASKGLLGLLDDVQSRFHTSGENPLQFVEFHAAGFLGTEEVFQDRRHQLHHRHLVILHHVRHLYELKLVLVKDLSSSHHCAYPDKGRSSTVKERAEVPPAITFVFVDAQCLHCAESVMVHILVCVTHALWGSCASRSEESL
mmetsp:Transcript_13801/g.30600  ORF Transcript_13801/g.30600 Transcript_13801/m.30600 type:complete len:288 (+) Transcript_13801:682-1545(+)